MNKMVRSLLTAAALLALAGCAAAPKAKSLADAKSHAVYLGTNRIHYVTVGQGAHTIVFVHCWAGNLGFWREQVPAFSARARLVLLDLPGHGRSDQPHADYTMDFFADAVLAVMRDARVDRATLVGHSMGVPVICKVYAKAPEKVAALVSIDGTLRRPKMPADGVEKFIGPFRTPEYRDHTRKFIATMFPVPGTEALRDEVIGELLNTPQHVMLGAMEGMFNPDQPDWDPKKLNAPVLVINARNPMWTAEYEQYVRSLSPQTDYHVIDGVGHWLMLEKPAEFNATLTGMLQQFDLIAKPPASLGAR